MDKLDAIEKAVNSFQATLVKLESRIESLETSHVDTKREVEEFKESLNFNEVKRQKTSKNLQSLEEKLNEQRTGVDKGMNELRDKVRELEDKNLYLEAYSRRENIKFENIPEQASHKEDIESLLRNFLETELGFSDAANIEIQRVHRLGKKRDDKPRPILARFLRYKDCEKLLSLGYRLRDTNFKMYQDLPLEIVERRRKQMDAFKKARGNNTPAFFSKAKPDKLYIRGKLWPAGKPFIL